MNRASDGSIVLATKHPRSSATWHWSVSLTRNQPYLKRVFSFDQRRQCQWHDYIKLPFGWQLVISHQDFHKRLPHD